MFYEMNVYRNQIKNRRNNVKKTVRAHIAIHQTPVAEEGADVKRNTTTHRQLINQSFCTILNRENFNNTKESKTITQGETKSIRESNSRNTDPIQKMDEEWSKDTRKKRTIEKTGKQAQLPGKLSNLTKGVTRERASKLLHQWKQSKGKKGDSVEGSELKEMEKSIILGLASDGKVDDLLKAGYTVNDLKLAGYKGVIPGPTWVKHEVIDETSSEEEPEEHEKLPQGYGTWHEYAIKTRMKQKIHSSEKEVSSTSSSVPTAPSNIAIAPPNSEEIIREHKEGKSINFLARKYKGRITKRDIRKIVEEK